MRRSLAAPALPSLFDDEPFAPVQAAPSVKAAPVKVAPKAAAPKPAAVMAAPVVKATPVVKAAPVVKATPAVKAAPKAASKSVAKPAAKSVARVAKLIPVKAAAPAPAASVRVFAETAGAGGRAWRLGGRQAVAYLFDSGLAGELLATEPKHLARAAMAVYYDRKGKAFAWQVRFDTERWDEVVRRLTA